MLPVNKYILKNEKRSKSGLKGPQCHKKKFVVNGMEAMYKDDVTIRIQPARLVTARLS